MWRKSSHSGNGGGECVERAAYPAGYSSATPRTTATAPSSAFPRNMARVHHGHPRLATPAPKPRAKHPVPSATAGRAFSLTITEAAARARYCERDG